MVPFDFVQDRRKSPPFDFAQDTHRTRATPPNLTRIWCPERAPFLRESKGTFFSLRSCQDLASHIPMSQGPILIFDKSALQVLSLDEANWLDNFFLTNIVPLFLAETLADLEKKVHSGKTPEQVVGGLSLRTPDMQAYPCTHHLKLIGGSLYGHDIPMDGRIPCNSGRVVNLDNQRGVYFERTPEEEALQGWYRGEFLDLERLTAKRWRRELSNIDHSETYRFFQRWFVMGKPKNLSEVKTFADALIDGSPQAGSLRFGLTLVGVPEEVQDEVMARWDRSGRSSVREFAPYFRHVYGVDLFFHLAIACDQISRVRPAGKADNKVDIAYLYYLPFCMVFSSSDHLHERVVPLFLRNDQSFVKGQDLKADLRKLDDHYSALSDDVKQTGFHRFADCPPEDTSYLVTRLWDKHLPDWRSLKQQKKPIDHSKDKEIIAQLNRIEEAARSSDPDEHLPINEMQFAQYERNPMRKKGKWDRFGPRVK